MDDHVALRPVDPMYRAVFADGSELHVRHGREAMAEEIRAVAGPARGGRLRPVRRLADRAVPGRDAELHRRRLRLGARPRAALAGRRCASCASAGSAGSAARSASFFDDERLQRIFGFQAMYAGVAPHEALALYSVITYMDTVEGVVRPRGRDARHAPPAWPTRSTKAGATIRYGAPVTRILRDGAAPSRGVELAGGERLAADVVVCNADLPVAYRTLLGGVDAPRVARRGRYSPSCLLWVAGVRGGRRRRRPTTTSTSGAQWDDVVRRAHRRRRADARPVDPRDAALARRPVAGAGRLLDAVRARAGAQPRRPGRLDAHREAAVGAAAARRWPTPATPSTW